MGIDLVKLACTQFGFLSGNAYKVLVYMCALALDTPNSNDQPARLYFAGWEPLALALGHDAPNETPLCREKGHDRRVCEVCQRRRDLYELVRRALRTLREHGAIRPLEDHPRTGRAQTFYLELSPAISAGLQPRHFSGHSPAVSAGPRTHEDLSQDGTTHLSEVSAVHARETFPNRCEMCGQKVDVDGECIDGDCRHQHQPIGRTA